MENKFIFFAIIIVLILIIYGTKKNEREFGRLVCIEEQEVVISNWKVTRVGKRCEKYVRMKNED